MSGKQQVIRYASRLFRIGILARFDGDARDNGVGQCEVGTGRIDQLPRRIRPPHEDLLAFEVRRRQKARSPMPCKWGAKSSFFSSDKIFLLK